MKYQALYDEAIRRDGGVFVRVADNIIPFDGYFTPARLDLDFFPEGSVHNTEPFDRLVEIIVEWAVESGSEHIGVKIIDGVTYTAAGQVFADVAYAMGYAHGAGLEGVYDVGTGKLIKRR